MYGCSLLTNRIRVLATFDEARAKAATNRTETHMRDAAPTNASAHIAASAQPKRRKKKLAKPYRYRPGNPSRRIARL